MYENQWSLRQCAINDCQLNYGTEAVEGYKKVLKARKLNKRKGVRTNVGDPSRNSSVKKGR